MTWSLFVQQCFAPEKPKPRKRNRVATGLLSPYVPFSKRIIEITDYLKAHGETSSAGLAKGLGWEQDMAYKRASKVSKAGHIMKDVRQVPGYLGGQRTFWRMPSP